MCVQTSVKRSASLSISRLPTLVLLAAAIAAPSPARAVGLEGQRVVARVTLAALPEPLHAVLAAHESAILERCVEPDGPWRRNPRTQDRDDWHFVALDAAATSASWEDRLQAARDFPIRRDHARQLFRQRGLKQGGELPWRLAETVDDLKRAFERSAEDDAIRLTGYLIHFCTDLADPFAATRDRRAAESGNAIFGDASWADPQFAHQDAGQRIGWELIRRNAERYREAIDPRSIRFEITVDDVAYAAHAWLLASFERLPQLCQADQAILERMQVRDGADFLARRDEYYQLLDAECGEICVDNLRRGAQIATTLIVTAWSRAGSPNPPFQAEVAEPAAQELTAAPTPPPAEGKPAAASTDAAAPQVLLVASQRSRVFHRSDCPHAARISEKNRVTYKSISEASADGKRPCVSCQPGQSTEKAEGS